MFSTDTLDNVVDVFCRNLRPSVEVWHRDSLRKGNEKLVFGEYL